MSTTQRVVQMSGADALMARTAASAARRASSGTASYGTTPCHAWCSRPPTPAHTPPSARASCAHIRPRQPRTHQPTPAAHTSAHPRTTRAHLLVQQNHVSARDLLRRLPRGGGRPAAAAAVAVRGRRRQLAPQVHRVHDSHDPVEVQPRVEALVEPERGHDRAGVGEPGSLDHDVVERAAAPRRNMLTRRGAPRRATPAAHRRLSSLCSVSTRSSRTAQQRQPLESS